MGMNIFDEDGSKLLWFIFFAVLSFLLVLSIVLISDRLSNFIGDLANIKYPPMKRVRSAFSTFFNKKVLRGLLWS